VLLVTASAWNCAAANQARAIMEMASTGPGVSSGDQIKAPWLAMTFVLGFTFLSTVTAWSNWLQRFYVYTTPSSSFVYLLTGTPGAHLLAGLSCCLSRAGIAAAPVIEDAKHRGRRDRWYWHFMALLWVTFFA